MNRRFALPLAALFAACLLVLPQAVSAKGVSETIGAGWGAECKKSTTSSPRSCCRKKRDACDSELCSGAYRACIGAISQIKAPPTRQRPDSKMPGKAN